MKRYYFFIFALLVTNYLISQKHNFNYMNDISNNYILERDSSINFNVSKNVFEVLGCGNNKKPGTGREIYYTNSYFVRNDSVFIGSKLQFKVISNGVLIALSDLSFYIKKDEKIYGERFYYPDGSIMLFGGEWKNGLKQGNWLFFDESGKQSGLIFKDGVIIDTFEIKRFDPDF